MNKQKKSILESNVLYTLIAIALGFVVGPHDDRRGAFF